MPRTDERSKSDRSQGTTRHIERNPERIRGKHGGAPSAFNRLVSEARHRLDASIKDRAFCWGARKTSSPFAAPAWCSNLSGTDATMVLK
jgi:hypothetical protein